MGRGKVKRRQDLVLSCQHCCASCAKKSGLECWCLWAYISNDGSDQGVRFEMAWRCGLVCLVVCLYAGRAAPSHRWTLFDCQCSYLHMLSSCSLIFRRIPDDFLISFFYDKITPSGVYLKDRGRLEEIGGTVDEVERWRGEVRKDR